MSKIDALRKKIVDRKQLFLEVKNFKKSNQKIVFTNGVFDILHRGHIQYLAETADFGDKLIVAINSDASVKRLGKGDSRPLQDEDSRAIIIAALSFVDMVVIFNDDTPFNLISDIIPDVLIKGGDYDASLTDVLDKKYIVGSDVVKENGGAVKVIQFVDGYSTTNIEEKIRRN